MKPRERFKSMTKQEKTMIVIVILLVICIITRWDYVKREAAEAFKVRIERSFGQTNGQTDTSEQTD